VYGFPRRSHEDVPQRRPRPAVDLKSLGAEVWWHASDLVPATGSIQVATWKDRVQSINLAQSNAYYQGIVVPSRWKSFPGLQIGRGYYDATYQVSSTSRTVLGVALTSHGAYPSSDVYICGLGITAFSSHGLFAYGSSISSNALILHTGTTLYASASNQATYSIPQVIAITWGTGDQVVRLYKNGVQIVNTANTSVTLPGPRFRVGTFPGSDAPTFSSTAVHFEYAVFPSVLSAATILSISTRLLAQYGAL